MSNFRCSISDSPHPGVWEVENPPGSLNWQHYEGWFLQEDGTALLVGARYKGEGKAYFIQETRKADHMYDASSLIELQR